MAVDLDFDAMAEALSKPSFRWKGTKYSGRIISLPQANRLRQTVSASGDDGVAVLTAFAEAFELPTDVVLELPAPLAQRLVRDFLGALTSDDSTPDV